MLFTYSYRAGNENIPRYCRNADDIADPSLAIEPKVCRFFIPADDRVRRPAEESGAWGVRRFKIMTK
jgi:hypothetical protein